MGSSASARAAWRRRRLRALDVLVDGEGERALLAAGD
jgi:hypothetical protein